MSVGEISADALEAAHWLIAGTTGSGKTYLARGLLEQLRRAGRRVGAVDKLSKLWGLTIAADGSGPGLEFVIFGGKRPGALPMRPQDGDRLGRLFVERNVPAIFDLGQWDADDQEYWVEAFSRAVFATNEAALHLAFDEAQAWVPANGGGGAYKAVKMLAEQGRGNGINLLLTAPRLNGIDVNVRQALGGMVAMRQTSGRDQMAVADLIGGHVSIDEKALRAELGTLPTGTGYVWSPTSAGIDRMAFGANATFDSSRTPRHGDAPPPPIAISSALIDELRAALTPTPPPGGDADQLGGQSFDEVVAPYRTRIAELEKSLVDAERARGVANGFGRDAHVALNDAARGLVAASAEITERLKRHLGLDEASATSAEAVGGGAVDLPPTPPAPKKSPVVSNPSRDGDRGAAGAGPTTALAASKPEDIPQRNATLGGLARTFLAEMQRRHPARLTWKNWAALVGRKPSGPQFNAALAQLRRSAAIVEMDGLARADSAGSGAPTDATDPIELWSRILPDMARRMMLSLSEFGPCDAKELSRRIGRQASGPQWNAALSQLRSNNLIDESAGVIALNPLFVRGDA